MTEGAAKWFRRLAYRCDGHERTPNPCLCECEGCHYHCGAHLGTWQHLLGFIRR